MSKKIVSSIFGGYVSEKPVVNLIGAGDHVVKVHNVFETDSLTNPDGSRKEVDKPYMDACPQLGVTFTQEGGGTLTHRFNGLGFYHTDDFDPEELKKQGLVDGDGYAMLEKDGQYVRVANEQRTADCRNILNQFMDALGLPEGSGLDQIVPGLELTISVEIGEWEGRAQHRIKRFKKAAAVAVAEETAELQ